LFPFHPVNYIDHGQNLDVPEVARPNKPFDHLLEYGKPEA